MDPVVSVQNKNFTGNTKERAKALGADEETKSHLPLTVPWKLAKHVKTFPGIIVRQHHTDAKQMGLLKEQCAE